MITLFRSKKLQKEKEELINQPVSALDNQSPSNNSQKVELDSSTLPPSNFSPPASKIIQTYQDSYLRLQAEVDIATIHVDEIASKVALFYEKVRKIVDWKEEHLVRRSAIERILKRKLISEISGLSLANSLNPEGMAEPLVLELIRGGHFPNDKIPRKKITEVKNALEKYIFILKNNLLAKNNHVTPKIKQKINFYEWILDIAACEIEEILGPPVREQALIDFMFTSMRERIQITPQNAIAEEEKNNQIYIAILRALYRLDDPIITHHLLKKRWKLWRNLPSSVYEEASRKIIHVKKEIEKELSHPYSNKFYALCEKYDTLYLILGDVLDMFAKTPAQISKTISDQKSLISYIKKAYNNRLSTLKSRLFRAAIYSTLSIFVAGSLSLFIFEIPLAKLFYGNFNPLAIVVDIMLPTILMFILVALVRPPKESNLDKVIKEIIKIVYQFEEKDVYEIDLRKKRRIIFNFLTSLLYLIVNGISLALVFLMFRIAQVPVTSLYLDTLNVAMIVFAALVIRQRAKELTVEEKVTFWEFLIDVLSIPIAKIGQWLANKWKEYNIVSVFFIALIDMPFSTFIEFIENWRSFLKEKQAELH
jgi:hypothetical protein